jgi:hypothetical protein
MSLQSLLWAIVSFIFVVAWIFFVIFGQITVRKLRKNPETQDALGIQFVSGWDIFNVAEALGLPKKYALRRKNLAFGMLRADADVLYKHTNKLDRILARVFLIPFAFAGAFVVVLMLLDLFGFFKH